MLARSDAMIGSVWPLLRHHTPSILHDLPVGAVFGPSSPPALITGACWPWAFSPMANSAPVFGLGGPSSGLTLVYTGPWPTGSWGGGNWLGELGAPGLRSVALVVHVNAGVAALAAALDHRAAGDRTFAGVPVVSHNVPLVVLGACPAVGSDAFGFNVRQCQLAADGIATNAFDGHLSRPTAAVKRRAPSQE